MCKRKIENLVVLRCIAGLNQKQVSEYLKVTLPTYCNKENGLRPFSLDEAKKLSELFNCTIEDIFFGNKVFKMNTSSN